MKSSTYLEPNKHHEYVPVQDRFMLGHLKNQRYYKHDITWAIWPILYEKILKPKKNSKEIFGKPRTFQKGLTYDMCENVCVSNKTCNFFTHTPKGFVSNFTYQAHTSASCWARIKSWKWSKRKIHLQWWCWFNWKDHARWYLIKKQFWSAVKATKLFEFGFGNKIFR